MLKEICQSPLSYRKIHNEQWTLNRSIAWGLQSLVTLTSISQKELYEIFTFKGNDLDLFNDNVASSEGGFVQMLNKYPFPNAKCPLGCWEFMDDCQ